MGPESESPPPSENEEVIRVHVVMPGLWDCHTHFQGETTPGMTQVAGFYPEKYIKFASALKQAKEAL